jgi:DNA-binding transcriptional LysR family regulator
VPGRPIEPQHRFHLFTRTNKKNVELTGVGRIFVEEARLALWHIDRAVHAAREGSDSILTIGHSPDADLAWISAILAIRLPMYPKRLGIPLLNNMRVANLNRFSSCWATHQCRLRNAILAASTTLDILWTIGLRSRRGLLFLTRRGSTKQSERQEKSFAKSAQSSQCRR